MELRSTGARLLQSECQFRLFIISASAYPKLGIFLEVILYLRILILDSAVSPEDKAVIRSRLLESGIEEYDHRLALQNAIVVAKVSRFEYPQDWYVTL